MVRLCERIAVQPRTVMALMGLGILVFVGTHSQSEDVATTDTFQIFAQVHPRRDGGFNLLVEFSCRVAVQIDSKSVASAETSRIRVVVRDEYGHVIASQKVVCGIVNQQLPQRLHLLPQVVAGFPVRLSQDIVDALRTNDESSLQVEIEEEAFRRELGIGKVAAKSNVVYGKELRLNKFIQRDQGIDKNVDSLKLRISIDNKRADCINATVKFTNRGDEPLQVYDPFRDVLLSHVGYRIAITTTGGHQVWEPGVGAGSQRGPTITSWTLLPPRSFVGRIFQISKEQIRQGLMRLPRSKRSEELVVVVYPTGRLTSPMPDFTKAGAVDGSFQWWMKNFSDDEGEAIESNPFRLNSSGNR